MRKIEKTYSLFLDPSFIEDYLPNVELPSPHLQFKQIVDADYLMATKSNFLPKRKKRNLLDMLKNAKWMILPDFH